MPRLSAAIYQQKPSVCELMLRKLPQALGRKFSAEKALGKILRLHLVLIFKIVWMW